MLKRLSSLGIVISLICFMCATSAFAGTGSEPNDPAAKPASSLKIETKTNEKLKADMLKLVADTKAGKGRPVTRSQFPSRQRNNLSTGAKIGIAAAIAGAIVVIVIVQKLNSDDD